MKKTIYLKKAVCFLLTASLSLVFSGCGSSNTNYEKVSDQDDTIYSICIIKSADNDYYDNLAAGFTDALYDLLGENHLNLTSETASADKNEQSLVTAALSDQTQLIFADGKSALSAAAETDAETPVIGAGVIDFHTTLHLLNDAATWNKKTGTNVTGVSSLPDMAEQLSLLIEATPDLQTVGILYSPEDTDSIFQNEQLEELLDEAGIPWKEYEIPSSSSSASSAQADYSNVVTPQANSVLSSKEGTDIQIDSIGESSVISGIIAPGAARAAKISGFWYGPKGTEKPDFSTFDFDAQDKSSFTTALSQDASTEEIVRYACGECSALFLSAGTMLSDQAALISGIASSAGVSTIAGDPVTGENTLACLYTDAYDMGYQAGKLAYRVLINGEDPGDIRIVSQSGNGIKLYQDAIASQMGLTFPKSFTDIDTYRDSYQPGQETSRLNQTSEGAHTSED